MRPKESSRADRQFPNSAPCWTLSCACPGRRRGVPCRRRARLPPAPGPRPPAGHGGWAEVGQVKNEGKRSVAPSLVAQSRTLWRMKGRLLRIAQNQCRQRLCWAGQTICLPWAEGAAWARAEGVEGGGERSPLRVGMMRGRGWGPSEGPVLAKNFTLVLQHRGPVGSAGEHQDQVCIRGQRLRLSWRERPASG